MNYSNPKTDIQEVAFLTSICEGTFNGNYSEDPNGGYISD